jgi:hypothetical protein
MKLAKRWFLALFFITPLATQSQDEVFWTATGQEVEFGVNSLSVLETGYNGAWLVNAGPQLYGIGQTFTVPSLQNLGSIQLRLAGHGSPVTGHFEVAVYRFDPGSGAPSLKLAAVSANAQDYMNFSSTAAPVSSFDFSSFNIALSPSETYALSVLPGADLTGGSLSLQAATDIYPGGEGYVLSVVPEPGTPVLLGLGIACWLVARRSLRAC